MLLDPCKMNGYTVYCLKKIFKEAYKFCVREDIVMKTFLKDVSKYEIEKAI